MPTVLRAFDFVGPASLAVISFQAFIGKNQTKALNQHPHSQHYSVDANKEAVMDPTSLPEDILNLVLELLGVNELVALSLTCRTMYTIVSYYSLLFG